jgi:hypothetical protein
LYPGASAQWFTILGSDKGTIEEEEYEFSIGVVSAIFNNEALEVRYL